MTYGKLIVFDIDETLFTSVDQDELKEVKLKQPKLRKADHSLQHGNEKQFMYARPYLKEFMNFSFKNFDYVGFYTMADGMWLRKFLKNLVGEDTAKKSLFLYDYTDSEAYKGDDEDRIKSLKKIWKKYGHLGINKGNTIFIEDTFENLREDPDNCIVVPEYNLLKNPDDITLPLLAYYIMQLKQSKPLNEQIKSKTWIPYTNKLLLKKGVDVRKLI